MATSRLSFTDCWPMYSASRRGRSDNSNVDSSSIIEPAITRSVMVAFLAAERLSLRQNLKGAFEQHVKGRITISIHGTLQRAVCNSAIEAEILEGRHDIRFDSGFLRCLRKILQLVFQLENDPFPGFLPDSGNGRQPPEIAAFDRSDQIFHRPAGKDRHGQLRA